MNALKFTGFIAVEACGEPRTCGTTLEMCQKHAARGIMGMAGLRFVSATEQALALFRDGCYEQIEFAADWSECWAEDERARL